jgi:hypothetical protein
MQNFGTYTYGSFIVHVYVPIDLNSVKFEVDYHDRVKALLS